MLGKSGYRGARGSGHASRVRYLQLVPTLVLPNAEGHLPNGIATPVQDALPFYCT